MSANGQIFLSLLLLLLGLWLKEKGARSPAYAAGVLLAALISMILYAAHFVSDYFTGEGVNEAVIYHLRYGLQGAGFAEYAGLVAGVLAGALASVVALFGLARKSSRQGGGTLAAYGNPAALLCVCLSIAIQPAAAAIYKLVPAASASQAAAGSSESAASHAEFGSYYAIPKAARSTGPTRNLVFIYAESLERTYFDESVFPGLITELRELEGQAVSFTQVEQVEGTGWTIAGMVASQCGIPLFAPSDGNSMSGMDTFLPAATCLGDLLKSDGYRLVYYGGAAIRFAGKGKFYATHGFDEVAGRAELRGKLGDAAYVSYWGLYDDTLLDLAFDKYGELAGAPGRFALFLLTLDTHAPDGHMSAKCRSIRYGDGSNPILNSVRCSDHLLGEFVRRIRASPAGKDTLIVVVSDHLAMRNSAYELLQQARRRNLFMVIDPREAQGRRIATPGSALDIGPTVMSFLGYEASIGLGRDLMNPDTQLATRAAFIRTRLADWNEPLSRFWGFPRIEQYLEVDADNSVLRIDGRSFAVPSLVEIDGRMQTVIRFAQGDASAMDLVRENGAGKAFVLVAGCTAKDPRLPAGRTCLFAGQGSQVRAQLILERAARFSPAELRRITGSAS